MRGRYGVALLTLASAIASAALAQGASPTPLDMYVQKPDASFGWTLVHTFKGRGYHGAVLALTSQTWLDKSQVVQPHWRHWLTITIPDDNAYHTGMLIIGDGDSSQPAPDKSSDIDLAIALQSHSVVAEVGQVPNQPLRFAETPDVARSEDGLIAYQQAKFARTHNPEDIVRLRMVKSASAAMTAVQDYLKSTDGGANTLDRFVVAGASKRGWTTWLTGATDSRVVAIIPIVADVLNTQVQLRHHWEAMGEFSPALADHVENGIIPNMVGTPEMAEVGRIEDPYSYLSRPPLEMPKYLINAAGDQFFAPDSSQFYWDAVRGDKQLRYLPNTDHGLGKSEVIQDVIGFYGAFLTGTPRPRYDWKVEDGKLIVHTSTTPIRAVLWRATNPKARDFRVAAIGRAYKSTPLTVGADGSYVVALPKPSHGYSASFVELTYPSGGAFPLVFTTQVVVTPDTLPYRYPSPAAKP